MVQRQSRPRREERSGDEFIEKVVAINRVSKVVKGGRRFSFTAVVVVGDGHGSVGAGIGRANEVPDAIRKGSANARKQMRAVPLTKGTLPHPVNVTYGATRVVLKPAAPGTGVIAGGGVRAVMEAAGVRDVLSKTLGSRGTINVIRATMKGLGTLRDPQEVRRRRLFLSGRTAPPSAPADIGAGAPSAVLVPTATESSVGAPAADPLPESTE